MKTRGARSNPGAAEPVDARHEGDGPELEIVLARDRAGAVTVAGTIELLAARGIAAGDAVAVWPARLSDAERAAAESAARAAFAGDSGVVGSVRVGLSGTTATVLAVRPWCTRGAAFVSRARGLALAALSARLAIGAPLGDALEASPSSGKVGIVAVRVPRFSFEPFGAARIGRRADERRERPTASAQRSARRGSAPCAHWTARSRAVTWTPRATGGSSTCSPRS